MTTHHVQLEMQDCYHKAEEGEARFTLLARDPLAPNLVRLWAALRECNITEAASQFAELVSVSDERYSACFEDEAKISSACEIAGEMEAFAARR